MSVQNCFKHQCMVVSKITFSNVFQKYCIHFNHHWFVHVNIDNTVIICSVLNWCNNVMLFSKLKISYHFSFTDFKKYNSCGTHFQCANKNCIDEDLKCDTVDHCGDNSDEAMEGFAQCGVKDGKIIRYMTING